MTYTIQTLPCLHGELAGLVNNTHSYRDDGDHNVLAVHGWMDNAASFIPLMDQLPEYNWFSLDFSGHGHSVHRPVGYSYHFTDYLVDIIRAVEALGWQKFHLIGHSLGANIACLYAATHPDRLHTLSLVDGFGLFTSTKASDSLYDLRKAVESLARYAQDKPRYYPDWQTLIKRRANNGDIPEAAAKILVEYGAEETAQGIRVLSDNRLKQRSFLYASHEQIKQIFSGITSPTRLFRASEGLLHHDKLAEYMALPRDIKLVDIVGGHHVHMEAAATIAPTLRQFWHSSDT